MIQKMLIGKKKKNNKNKNKLTNHFNIHRTVTILKYKNINIVNKSNNLMMSRLLMAILRRRKKQIKENILF